MTTSKPRPLPAPGETRAYPVLPLRDIVVFPHMIVQLFVGREKSIKALEEVMRSDTFILLATQKNASDDDPATGAIFEIGTLASVLQLLKLPDGTVKVLVEGAERAKILKYNDRPDYYEASAVTLADEIGDRVEAEALARSVVTEFEGYVKLNKKVSPEVIGVVQQIEDYGKLGDTVASHLAVKIPDKQAVLETTKVSERLEKVLALMESEISVLQVEKRIRTRVKRQMEKTQREYYLNEQMKAIQKELGDEEGRDELTELEEKIKKTKLSKEGRDKAMHELKKLKQMSPMSAEATVVRNYLDWLLSIPWNKKSKVKKDLPKAQAILDHDHYGLEKVKERIVEYLAVQSRANKLTGPILCLVGPPGVGKTSLGKSIAKATGREFVRVSLGGVRDEAEIRGHRRTYIGSMPGKIIQSMRKAKTSNPLFLLDEIDKMGADFRGDPSSALLEVLDPEQNGTFSDHYLEVEYDLSNVMFITTANTLNIPPPLMDRMEIIRIAGYTENEKVEIARKHLIPNAITKHILDAISLVRRDRRLCGIFAITLIFNLFAWPCLSLIPVIGKDGLNLGPTGVGLLASMEGVGSIGGVLAVYFFGRPAWYPTLFVFAVLAYLTALTTFAILPNAGLAGLALLIAGLGGSGFAISQSTLAFHAAQPEMRARILGLLSVSIGTGPIGFLQVGLLADTLGAQAAIIISGCEGLTALLLTRRLWREIRMG